MQLDYLTEQIETVINRYTKNQFCCFKIDYEQLRLSLMMAYSMYAISGYYD